MFTYQANDGEIETLREVFGNRVDAVTFYDTEEGGGDYALIIAFDRDGTEIKQLDADDDEFDEVEELARERGETVKFGLRDVAPQPLPADEQALADLLDKVRRAAKGDSNDDEIDAYRDALEHALGRWPGLAL